MEKVAETAKGVIVAASVNNSHGNVPSSRFDRLYEEELGLDILGQSGLNIIINCHGLDFLMYPWLRGYFEKYPNLQLADGLFSHVIPTLIFSDYLSWQQELGTALIQPNIPICFFPEFCNPENPKNVKNNFWLLDSQNHYYSLDSDVVTWKNAKEITAPAIKYAGRTGLVMKEKGYKPILDAFFLAQRLPDDIRPNGQSNLDFLVSLIANLQEIVILPLDLEALYVGSLLGQIFWQRFVAKIKENHLEKMFLDFNETFPILADQSEATIDAPHRNLAKWTSLPATFALYSKINHFSRQKLSEQEKYLLAIAAGADLAAAIYQKTCKNVSRPAIQPDGTMSAIQIGGSKEVIDSTYLALETLEKGGQFAKKLENLSHGKSMFWQRLTVFAKELHI